MKILIKTLAVIILFTSTFLNGQVTVPYRVNSGATNTSTHNGNTYEIDTYFTGGNTSNLSSYIPNLADLYQYERWGTFSYDIPIANGNYDVVLHFAEGYPANNTISKRVFDAEIEGILVLDNYDIVQDVGFGVSVSKTFTNIAVNDGILTLAFSANGSGGEIDQGKLSGFEILSATSTNIALGKPVIVDSEYNVQFTAEKAVDGNNQDQNNRWLSANTSWPHWAEIDLEGDFEIEQIKFWTGSNGYNMQFLYEFQIWDGFSWNTVVDGTNNNSAIINITFPKVKTSKVRLFGTGEVSGQGAGNILRLYELEVYGVQVPTAPILSTTAKTDTTVDLSWTTSVAPNTYINDYKIYKNGNYEVALSGGTRNYQVTGLTAGTSYDFTIIATEQSTGNKSPFSNIVNVTTNSSGADTEDPTTPSNLVVSNVTNTTADLSWTAATDNIAVTGYKIFKDGVLEATLGNVLTYQVTGLTAATTYNFTVTALDAAGNASLASNVVSVTTNGLSPFFTLEHIRGSDDIVMGLLNDGYSITENNATAFNVKATASSPILSTTFSLTGPVTHTNTENNLPHALYGDGGTNSTDFNEGPNLLLGNYTLTVTGWSASGGTGTQVGQDIINFSVTTNSSSGGNLGYWSKNNQDIYYNNGNIGIGTNSPDEKLAVNGTIHSKEVRVDLNNWPDYVFAKDYKLPSLQELEAYIKTYRHLPNIAPATEIEKNGLLLGNINAKLLEKIEELTLYIIQQEKTIKAQKEQNQSIEQRLEQLEILVKKLKNRY